MVQRQCNAEKSGKIYAREEAERKAGTRPAEGSASDLFNLSLGPKHRMCCVPGETPQCLYLATLYNSKITPAVSRSAPKQNMREPIVGSRIFFTDTGVYSASRISRILIAAVEIGVPGPKIAAAPSR